MILWLNPHLPVGRFGSPPVSGQSQHLRRELGLIHPVVLHSTADNCPVYRASKTNRPTQIPVDPRSLQRLHNGFNIDNNHNSDESGGIPLKVNVRQLSANNTPSFLFTACAVPQTNSGPRTFTRIATGPFILGLGSPVFWQENKQTLCSIHFTDALGGDVLYSADEFGFAFPFFLRTNSHHIPFHATHLRLR